MSEENRDVTENEVEMYEHTNDFGDGLPPILSPTEDLIFKMIFTKRKNLLTHMLRAVIQTREEDFFEGIQVTNPDIFPEHTGGKLGVLDIKVTVVSGKIVNVEMQKKNVAHYRERIVSYLSGMVREQIGSGEEYEKIKRVISITIAGKKLIGDDAYHHRYTLYDPETRSEFTDLLEVHVIELPKLPKEDDGSDLWKWMKFISVKEEEDLKMVATMSPIMEEAATCLRSVSEDERTRQMLQSIRRREADDRVRLLEALEEEREKWQESIRRREADDRVRMLEALEVEREKWQESIRRREADDRVRMLEALEVEREKWQGVVAEKEDVIMEQTALIAELKARLDENK